MTDIHAHILPGMDDGAADMYETLEMAQMAVDSGVTELVATPHCNIPGLFDNYYGQRYLEVFQQTNLALKNEGIPLALYPGMEVFVTPDLPRLISQGKILTLNKSRYILVEFDFYESPSFAHTMLTQIRALGFLPVIAHPERYQFVQENPGLALDWKSKGYLLQLNKGSVLGRFGSRVQNTAHTLLDHKAASVIASDAHRPQHRTPRLLEAYKTLEDTCPKGYLNVLFEDNPKRICANQPTFRVKTPPYIESDKDDYKR